MKKPSKTAAPAAKPPRPPKPPRVLAPDGGSFVAIDGKPVREEDAAGRASTTQPVKEG